MHYLWRRFLQKRHLSLGTSALVFGVWGIFHLNAQALTTAEALPIHSSLELALKADLAKEREALSQTTPLSRFASSRSENVRQQSRKITADLNRFALSRSAVYQGTASLSSESGQTRPDFDLLRRTVRLAAQWGSIEAATEFYQQHVMTNPFDAEGYLNLGSLYYRQGDYRQAILTYLPALALAPEDAMLNQAVGLTYLQMGHREDAIDFLQRASQLAPTAQSMQTTFQFATVRQPRSEAVGHRPTRVVPPQEAKVYIQLGDLAWSYGDLDSALRFYQQADALQPDQTKILIRLADLWMLQRDYENAALAYEKLILINPDDPEIFYEMGVALTRQDDLTEAQRVLETALELYRRQNNDTGIQKTARMLQMF